MEYLVKIKLNVVKWKRTFIKKEEKRNYYYFSLPLFLFIATLENFFVFPDRVVGGDPLSTCLYQLLTDLLSPEGKEEKLFLRSPSFRALSRVKIIDPDSLSTKALQPYRRRTSPFLPSSPSFRQKLNAAIHDRAEGPAATFLLEDRL